MCILSSSTLKYITQINYTKYQIIISISRQLKIRITFKYFIYLIKIYVNSRNGFFPTEYRLIIFHFYKSIFYSLKTIEVEGTIREEVLATIVEGKEFCILIYNFNLSLDFKTSRYFLLYKICNINFPFHFFLSISFVT